MLLLDHPPPKSSNLQLFLLPSGQLASSAVGNEKQKYCITLLTSFSHQQHLAIVTECMHQSLRKLLKIHTSGISIAAVRVYGKQLFSGLSYIHAQGILHADLKLDNIVISTDKKRLKICDFGSAILSHELSNVRDTTELVSRFYRAPEIIMGDTPTYGIDIWSGACCLFELCVGTLPFTGEHNNGMLRQFMEISGRFSKKVRAPLNKENRDLKYLLDLIFFDDSL